MVIWTEIDAAPGWRLRLAGSEQGLCQVHLANADGAVETELAERFGGEQFRQDPNAALFAEATVQLRAYFHRELREFTVPLELRGTPFQVRVWSALRTIPYGETRSYRQLAEMVDSPNGSRAVGMANGSNPVGIIVPCHRVIASTGKLQGYGWGLPAKKKLLDLEAGRLTLDGF